ncbi:hypothetical protein [Streptomyces collinus]|uniref:hypothetical protein n=1 Tax=Streptomyces collinus TaxID=42684 RepID=UPI0029424134|nr:hypothetical protein [Streptomyces collinus]
METESASDTAAVVAAAARHARFGKLPEPIRFHEMTEEKQAAPSASAAVSYDPEASWNHFSCLALDLGL